jgi:hypothetical protein
MTRLYDVQSGIAQPSKPSQYLIPMVNGLLTSSFLTIRKTCGHLVMSKMMMWVKAGGGYHGYDWCHTRAGHCDQVTWCFGPFSLVSSSILNLSFLSLTQSHSDVFPPFHEH